MKSEKLFIDWMVADLGFVLVGCLIISVAEKGILLRHRVAGSKPFAQSLQWRSCIASFAVAVQAY